MFEESLRAALRFLSGTAIVRDDMPPGPHSEKFGYTRWNGAIRGEYAMSAKQWDTFCPVWHTGQAVKAFCTAAAALHDESFLAPAAECAEFLLACQLHGGDDHGLLLAFEDHPRMVNTSAILEALDGLFLLSDATGNPRYENAALEAAQWAARKSWLPAEGRFLDTYDIENGRFAVLSDLPNASRPLLDDGIFLKCHRRTGEKRFMDIAVSTAERLLADEGPAGNWIKYHPCLPETGSIHPRHAFWWGRPMAEMFRQTGDERYRELFFRSVNWYEKAIRRDGGLFRSTFTDFNTESFGHAASGSACAALCFMDRAEFGDAEYFMELAERCIAFCTKMQLTSASDPAMNGVIIEKVLPPDGSDRCPYYIRDLGTIFFIQALAGRLIKAQKK